MADASTILGSLPEPIQLALSVGTGVAAVGAAIYRIAAPRKANEASAPADKAIKPTDVATLPLAMLSPLSDPNQLRLMLEAVNRLGEFTEQIVDRQDDIKSLLSDLKEGQKLQREALRELKR